MTNPTATLRPSPRGVLTLLACALCVWAGYAFWVDMPAAAQADPPPEAAPDAAAEAPPTGADTPGAQETPETQPEPPANSDTKSSEAAVRLLADARQKLLGRPFRARLTEVLGRGDHKLRAEGEFIQGPDLRMRLDVRFQTGGTDARLLQVCDGEVLFTEQQINDSLRLTRCDVLQILAEVERVGADAKSRLVGELGLGGIVGLLASLEQTMTFGPPQQETVDGEPLHVIKGRWNEEFMARIQASPQAAKQTPQHLPDGVRVYFDNSGFPRRIRYLKWPSPEDPRPLVTLDFNGFEWLDGSKLDAGLFHYEAPDGVYQKPLTQEYLQMIRGQ